MSPRLHLYDFVPYDFVVYCLIRSDVHKLASWLECACGVNHISHPCRERWILCLCIWSFCITVVFRSNRIITTSARGDLRISECPHHEHVAKFAAFLHPTAYVVAATTSIFTSNGSP